MATIIEQHRADFDRAIEHLEGELHQLRSGRAQAGLVESIHVPAYDSSMELKGVAAITTPDAKTIQIEPWDKELVGAIEKALIEANLGMQPNVSGTVIRLVMPPMTEENRDRLAKQAHEKGEAARITVRNVREQVRDALQKAEKAKEISEDEKHRLQESLDKLVKEVNERIESVIEQKEKEIRTI